MRPAYGIALVLVVALLLTIYSIWIWSAPWPRRVLVHNATYREYSVRLNGVEYKLAGRTILTLTLNEGTYTLEPGSPSAPFQAQTIEIRTPFLRRPWNHAVFVLNPDRQGVVTITTLHYQTLIDPRADPEGWKRQYRHGRGPEETKYTGDILASYEVDDVLVASPDMKADLSDRTRLDIER